MYAIVDIETTGLSPRTERITEIAIILHDGIAVTERYSTLLNPEIPIPYFITKLTGISNDMVAGSPYFYEAAETIARMLEGRIFIAHNVNFDFSFIQAEFNRLGYYLKNKCACSARTSRLAFPGFSSYSLGELCRNLGIVIHDRHRAMGDAEATAILWEMILKSGVADSVKQSIASPGNHVKFKANRWASLVNKLPEAPGVYYFHDKPGDVIYVGKSTCIRKRVMSHISGNARGRQARMLEMMEDISFELTGSDLLARLKESDEIKKLQPVFNRSQRRTLHSHCIISFHDDQGYLNLKIDKTKPDKDCVMTVANREHGIQIMESLCEKFNLCQKLTGLYPSRDGCFHYMIHRCKGACKSIEPTEEYNRRAIAAIESVGLGERSFLVIENGRKAGEKAVVCIEHGKYVGFGYFEEHMVTRPWEVRDAVKVFNDNRDVQNILRSFMASSQEIKVIYHLDSVNTENIDD
jgi:DNA polymerase III subunit epsilon